MHVAKAQGKSTVCMTQSLWLRPTWKQCPSSSASLFPSPPASVTSLCIEAHVAGARGESDEVARPKRLGACEYGAIEGESFAKCMEGLHVSPH